MPRTGLYRANQRGPAIPESVPGWIAIAALVIAAISLLLSLFVATRGRRSRGRSPAAVRVSGAATEADLERVGEIAARLDMVARRLEAAETQGQRATQRVGVVRYNPFEDTGSNQSFVLALLDARGDGIVLSSLHSRQQTRVFLKQVTQGKAETALSEEETEAIRRATEV